MTPTVGDWLSVAVWLGLARVLWWGYRGDPASIAHRRRYLGALGRVTSEVGRPRTPPPGSRAPSGPGGEAQETPDRRPPAGSSRSLLRGGGPHA